MFQGARINILLANAAGLAAVAEMMQRNDLREAEVIDFLFSEPGGESALVMEVYDTRTLFYGDLYDPSTEEPRRRVPLNDFMFYRELEFAGKRRNSRLRADSVRSRRGKR